jgi:hypothetical protein
VDTTVGGLLVPNATSYDVARVDAAHFNNVDVVTPDAPSTGDGLRGIAGGAATVVNDHSGPAVDPPGPLAVMRQ